jgi:hypothetical protein
VAEPDFLSEEEADEADEIIAMIYEDALCDETPWALEAYQYRQEHWPL